MREVLEETKEAVGDSMAVADPFLREHEGADGQPDTTEPRAMLEMLAELPDLWDITVHDYSWRWAAHASPPRPRLEDTMSWVKEVTSKPVVSVGRFTSPETMLRLVRQGVVDLVGAARPSIADPFLPRKIAEGRDDEIRECIGCNICYAGDQTGTPIRCTQNPTMGEEWRKGWHPEQIAPKGSDASILIVGAGPAGMEAAVALGQRGYEVVLTEARNELGGRSARESRLPGMAAYARVRDWRLTQIDKLDNVEAYPGSLVDEDQIHEFGADHVLIATGATWRRDGTGAWLEEPVPGWRRPSVLTPDDIMDGVVPNGPVVVFDDDHYYMGGVVAERLRMEGLEVTLVTPANEVSTWTNRTEEQHRIQSRVLNLGIHVVTGTSLASVEADHARLECIYTGKVGHVDAAAVVMTTSRQPVDELFTSLHDRIPITRIGDCTAPGTMAAAVYAGHQFARELDAAGPTEVRFLRERAVAP